ncbi:MAG: oligosaccharide flippase family protein [Clostridia bacterium]|nr:oligosaccharide flippase family protein [Clostridia bacterium]
MSGAKILFKNTLLLTAASFLMRTVSVSFNVYLTNRIGADGIGLFQLIFAVYALAITFACSGIRLTATRLVADNLALGKKNSRQLVRYCILYSLVCAVVTSAVLLIFSDFIGTKWIGDPRSIAPLKMLCVSLPFVSISEALDGYFTAVGKLVRYTFVQFLEQVFKITVTVIALNKAVAGDLRASCLAVTFGISAAEIFSLMCVYILYRFTSEKSKISESGRKIVSRLLKISIPDAVGSEMRSILMTIEHLLIPAGLKKSGSNAQNALASYGVIHGMSLPLLLYPSALLSSLSGLLIPEISSHHISGSKVRISYIISRVLHITLIFSIGTAGIMYFNADRLSLAVYGNVDSAFYIKLIAPLIPIMYTDMSVDGMLKGLDQQVSCMRYNIIDAALCVILVYILVPVMGVEGYVVVIFASECINFFLSFRRLTVVSEVRVELFKDILIPSLCVISSNLFKNIVFGLFPVTTAVKSTAAVEIVFSVVLYAVLLLVFRAVDNEELSWVKKLIKP